METSLQFNIEKKLKEAFSPLYLEVINESKNHHRDSDGESHFKVIIASPSFEGKSRVDRQRMVQMLFDAERARGLHALTMTTFTPSEWESQKSKMSAPSPTCLGGGKH